MSVSHLSIAAFSVLLFLLLKIKGTNGQVTRADILQVGLRELLNALFTNPVDDNLICAVKLLKVGFSLKFLFNIILCVLVHTWKLKDTLRGFLSIM